MIGLAAFVYVLGATVRVVVWLALVCAFVVGVAVVGLMRGVEALGRRA